jgi:hypothetical protein
MASRPRPESYGDARTREPVPPPKGRGVLPTALGGDASRELRACLCRRCDDSVTIAS